MKKKKGYLIKLDLEKAFDKVDWTFLDNIFEAKGFWFLMEEMNEDCVLLTSPQICR